MRSIFYLNSTTVPNSSCCRIKVVVSGTPNKRAHKNENVGKRPASNTITRDKYSSSEYQQDTVLTVLSG